MGKHAKVSMARSNFDITFDDFDIIVMERTYLTIRRNLKTTYSFDHYHGDTSYNNATEDGEWRIVDVWTGDDDTIEYRNRPILATVYVLNKSGDAFRYYVSDGAKPLSDVLQIFKEYPEASRIIGLESEAPHMVTFYRDSFKNFLQE